MRLLLLLLLLVALIVIAVVMYGDIGGPIQWLLQPNLWWETS